VIVDCVADLHGFYPNLQGGDLLIIAGDLTKRDSDEQQRDFIFWLASIQCSVKDYKKIIYIAGNHDNFFYDKDRHGSLKTPHDWGIEYLCDSGTEFDGLKIWGSPWTPIFDGVNPKCKAFMEKESCLDEKFSLIPENLDILITHGPMRHMLDNNMDGHACGSSSLRKHIDRTKPRYHVFGHIHENGGNELMYNRTKTWCLNCSHVNERYEPVNGYIRVII
jgi:Icc-related predicted phosphoesterase